MRSARQGQEAPEFIFKETNPGRIHFASLGEGTDTMVLSTALQAVLAPSRVS